MNLLKKSGFALPIAILIVVVLIVAGGTGYYFYKSSSIGKYSSPEKTYSLYIKAMEEGDVDTYLECHTEESQKILKPGIVTPEGLKTMEILFESRKEGGIKVTERTADSAVMTLGTGKALYFKKEKDNWKVDIIRSQRDARRMTDLLGFLRSGALEFYYDQHASYPVLTDTSEDGEFLKVLVDEGYLAEMLLDPLHPEYFYEYEGTRDSYILKCHCEIEGGDCDMVDGVKDHVLIITFPK